VLNRVEIRGEGEKEKKRKKKNVEGMTLPR
jgi:hypothetical protein